MDREQGQEGEGIKYPRYLVKHPFGNHRLERELAAKARHKGKSAHDLGKRFKRARRRKPRGARRQWVGRR